MLTNYHYCYFLFYLVTLITTTMYFSLKKSIAPYKTHDFCYAPLTAAATHQSWNCIIFCYLYHYVLYYLSHNVIYYCVVVVVVDAVVVVVVVVVVK